MNRLPEDVLDTIYEYKHQVEFKDVLNELIQHKTNCRLNVTIGMLTYMFYVTEEGVRIPSIDVADIEVYAVEILSRINSKTYYSLI